MTWSPIDVMNFLDLLFALTRDIQPLAHFAESGARLAGGMDYGFALGDRDVFARRIRKARFVRIA